MGAEVARLFRVEGARVFGVDVVPSQGVTLGDLTDAASIQQMADAHSEASTSSATWRAC